MRDLTRRYVPLLMLLALPACEAGPSGDKPGRRDSAIAGQVAPPTSDFPNTDIGRQLTEHMAALSGVGKDAEDKYQASLAALRAHSAEAARQLVESYPSINEGRYFRRWAFLETLRELHDSSSLGFAVRVAESPLPPERFTSDPERSSVDEERRIRIKAVEILAALAEHHVAAADSALRRLVKHADLGIRRTAIRGYLAAGGPDGLAQRTEYLKRLVAPGDSALVTLATTEVRSVPHPDMPAQFDLGKGRPTGPPPSIPSR